MSPGAAYRKFSEQTHIRLAIFSRVHDILALRQGNLLPQAPNVVSSQTHSKD